jgi:hypothetical protein
MMGDFACFAADNCFINLKGCSAVVCPVGSNEGCPEVTSTGISILIAPVQTCEASADGPGLFPVPSTTTNANSTTTIDSDNRSGVEPWVIAVAVAVPLAILAGVGVALLIVYLHKKAQADFTFSQNQRLKEMELGAMQ